MLSGYPSDSLLGHGLMCLIAGPVRGGRLARLLCGRRPGRGCGGASRYSRRPDAGAAVDRHRLRFVVTVRRAVVALHPHLGHGSVPWWRRDREGDEKAHRGPEAGVARGEEGEKQGRLFHRRLSQFLSVHSLSEAFPGEGNRESGGIFEGRESADGILSLTPCFRGFRSARETVETVLRSPLLPTPS